MPDSASSQSPSAIPPRERSLPTPPPRVVEAELHLFRRPRPNTGSGDVNIVRRRLEPPTCLISPYYKYLSSLACHFEAAFYKAALD